MVSCDYENYGCSGGWLSTSILYLIEKGLVLDSCLSYKVKNAECTYQCDDPSVAYTKFYCKQGSAKVLIGKEKIMEEIMTNGPVMVELVIYEDFFNYASGTYSYVTGARKGAHAMVLHGWGIDGSGNFFWLCQN